MHLHPRMSFALLTRQDVLQQTVHCWERWNDDVPWSNDVRTALFGSVWARVARATEVGKSGLLYIVVYVTIFRDVQPACFFFLYYHCRRGSSLRWQKSFIQMQYLKLEVNYIYCRPWEAMPNISNSPRLPNPRFYFSLINDVFVYPKRTPFSREGDLDTPNFESSREYTLGERGVEVYKIF